jgi:hypothetical protein
MENEDQDLEQYLAEQAAAGQEETVAPVEPVRGFLRDAQRQELAQKFYDSTMADQQPDPQLAGIEARMAPQTDKNGNPVNPLARNPLVGLGQALSGISKSRNDVIQNAPNLRLGTKLAAASKAGWANALGGLADSVMDKKRSDAEAQLNADAKRAAMFRQLHPKGGASAQYGQLLNVDQRERQLQENQSRYDAKAQAAAEENSSDSEVSKNFAKSMLDTGVFKPEEVEGKSMAQLKAMRTAKMQTDRIERGAQEKDRGVGNELYVAEEKRRAQQAQDIMDERRKQGRADKEREIPGLQAVKPVTEQTYKEALPLRSAHRVLVDGNRELAEIQKKLELNKGILGGATGQFQEWLGSDEGKQLLARAKQLHTGKVNATRVLENFGVPQEFELKLINGMNPEAGSLSGFFKGPANWEEAAKFADERLRGQLFDRGYVFPDDTRAYARPEAPPVDSQLLKVDRQFTPYQAPARGAKTRGEAESVPTVSERLPAQSKGTQKYSITVDGQTTQREWTPEKLREFMKNAQAKGVKFEVTGVK